MLGAVGRLEAKPKPVKQRRCGRVCWEETKQRQNAIGSQRAYGVAQGLPIAFWQTSLDLTHCACVKSFGCGVSTRVRRKMHDKLLSISSTIYEDHEACSKSLHRRLLLDGAH